MSHVQELGFGEVMDRGARAVEDLPAELVYAGFSLGVVVAQKLAQTRPGARGALLFYSCVPVTEFSAEWPDGVPVQVHGMDKDPFFAEEGDPDATAPADPAGAAISMTSAGGFASRSCASG